MMNKDKQFIHTLTDVEDMDFLLTRLKCIKFGT